MKMVVLCIVSLFTFNAFAVDLNNISQLDCINDNPNHRWATDDVFTLEMSPSIFTGNVSGKINRNGHLFMLLKKTISQDKYIRLENIDDSTESFVAGVVLKVDEEGYEFGVKNGIILFFDYKDGSLNAFLCSQPTN